MTYGPTDIMGASWETAVKIYAQKLKGNAFILWPSMRKTFLRSLRAPTGFSSKDSGAPAAGSHGQLLEGRLRRHVKKHAGGRGKDEPQGKT